MVDVVFRPKQGVQAARYRKGNTVSANPVAFRKNCGPMHNALAEDLVS